MTNHFSPLAESLRMSPSQLKKALEDLENDFKNIPDDKKNFIELQDRLESLLKLTAELSSLEREPLLPTLRHFQTYLQEHLEDIQKQASFLQMNLQEKATHKKAVQAYGSIMRQKRS